MREGSYRIGGWENDQPSATVQLPAFWLGCYPITVAQYVPFVAEGYSAGAQRWWTPAEWKWKAKRTNPWDGATLSTVSPTSR
ncbi:SUMF1/EgtB/PvdO family nonheme iron enzyme [Chloroflexales bacterium ZM16-3]|nr:SUMF1/EgtB/PvdO family nonheme iron enzyme [Chloroflexales bacterium ZM16-3]